MKKKSWTNISPPKEYNIVNSDDQFKIVLNKVPTTNEFTKYAKIEKTTVRRNLDMELQIPSNSVLSKDSGTGTIVKNTHQELKQME